MALPSFLKAFSRFFERKIGAETLLPPLVMVTAFISLYKVQTYKLTDQKSMQQNIYP